MYDYAKPTPAQARVNAADTMNEAVWDTALMMEKLARHARLDKRTSDALTRMAVSLMDLVLEYEKAVEGEKEWKASLSKPSAVSSWGTGASAASQPSSLAVRPSEMGSVLTGRTTA